MGGAPGPCGLPGPAREKGTETAPSREGARERTWETGSCRVSWGGCVMKTLAFVLAGLLASLLAARAHRAAADAAWARGVRTGNLDVRRYHAAYGD